MERMQRMLTLFFQKISYIKGIKNIHELEVIAMKKLKRKNVSIDDVMQKVAEKNGYKYVPPEKRTSKKLVYSKSITGETFVSLVDTDSKKLGRRKIKKQRNVQKYWQMIHRKIFKICCIILSCSI